MTSRLRKESTNRFPWIPRATTEGAGRCRATPSSGAVTFIQVEAGMNPHNVKHVPLGFPKKHLEERGYALSPLTSRLPNGAANRACDSPMPRSDDQTPAALRALMG